MPDTVNTQTTPWPLWRKLIFRFLFIFFCFEISPWEWLRAIPGVPYITQFYDNAVDWAVALANAKLFHVRPVLVPTNGSGDTSAGWAQVWFILCVALIGCIIWSVADRKRKNYTWLNYWLCLFGRYYVALVALTYGIIKVFSQQMIFPSLHQLATPLGDLLPMRFSWLFIGYSKPYQMFSGFMELTAALLLLYRRTATLGILLATGVFMNVMMLNLCYDIPVKIFSMLMELLCLFLLANEGYRIFYFFILNKPAPVGTLYHFAYTKKWQRVTRIVLKCIFIIVALVIPFYYSYNQFSSDTGPGKQPVKNGVYEVTVYQLNKNVVPYTYPDTLRWQDVIFEDGTGSVKSADTVFRQRYKRGYFAYKLDAATHKLLFQKLYQDNVDIAEFDYTLTDSNTIKLWGVKGNDSLHVELKRTNRHFQLAEKQFHWLSEHNR